MSGGYVLAIDLGTSACKVALATTAGEIAALEMEEIPLRLLPGGGAEQDPGDWWQAIKNATVRLWARGMAAPDEVVAVACTAQWSGTVAVDRNGQPLMPAIIWMDSRGARYARAITGGPLSIQGYGLDKLWRWVRKTAGIPAGSGKDSIAHILYLKHERPEIYQAAYKFLEPKDYLNLRLTGRFAASYDSIALHWVTDNRDPARIQYDQELLHLAGIDREKLPDLKRAVDILGPLTKEAAAELGLSPDTLVVMGTPDVQSAAIGSGATRDFQAHLYVGTSSWLTCHVPYKKTDLFHNMASLPSAIPGRYLVANEQESAGVCLTFLRDNVFFHADELLAKGESGLVRGAYQAFDRLAAEAPPGSGGVIFTPWLYGERTPVEDRFVRGGFHNLSLQTTRPDLVRAVFEGVAYNTRWLLEAVEGFVGRRLGPIRFIGGGARSEVWSQILADVLDRTIEQVRDPVEANVRGAAILGAVSLGALSFDGAADRVQVAKIYHPRLDNRHRYDELYRAFVDLYRRNRKIHARLNHGA